MQHSSASHSEGISERKSALRDLAERLAPNRHKWIKRNSYYYEEDQRYLQFLIPKGAKVLELGCGIGDTLAAVEPSYGVGPDMGPAMIEVAKTRHPGCNFIVGDIENPEIIQNINETFDFIILGDTIGDLEDVVDSFAALHPLCTHDTRVIISYYSPLWRPILKLAEKIGAKMPSHDTNWLTLRDIGIFLELANFEVIRREWWQILPKKLLGLGPLINRYIGTLPVIRALSLRNYIVVRSLVAPKPELKSCTVLVPARNEKGNIEAAITRTPKFCDDIEFMFVEGHSSDGTLDEMERVKAAYPDEDIKVLVQDGKGKGDAVRKGFENARGDVLMILDADLTTPPEQMPKFFDTIASGKGEFINGTRLIYPMDDEAMRFLNFLANHTFPVIFSYLLNQRFTDTLCGTKVLSREHYNKIADNRSYFGDFDPFGDFDLIFGASKLNLKITEVPVRYASRVYGETQISRFTHGFMLLKMIIFAYKKLKAF